MTTNRTSTSTMDYYYPINIGTYWQSTLYSNLSTTNSTTSSATTWVRRDTETLINGIKKMLDKEITEDDVMNLIKDDD